MRQQRHVSNRIVIVNMLYLHWNAFMACSLASTAIRMTSRLADDVVGSHDIVLIDLITRSMKRINHRENVEKQESISQYYWRKVVNPRTVRSVLGLPAT